MSTKVHNGQNVFGNACGTPASTKKQFSLVAGIPRAPKSSFSLLRESRKAQKALFPRCGIPAKPKKHFFLVAEIPRAPKSSFCSLRDSRKHFRKHFVRPSTLTKTWCGRKEPHSYVELTYCRGRMIIRPARLQSSSSRACHRRPECLRHGRREWYRRRPGHSVHRESAPSALRCNSAALPRGWHGNGSG